MSSLPPTISVIIPTRNRRDKLERAISSVRSQTLLPAEIIIVDDASQDGTAAWLRAEMPDIHLIALSRRGGASRARNAGIRAAQGEFIAFLDSDDVFMPQKLERQIAALQKSNAVFSTSGFSTSRGRKYCISTPKKNQILRKNCLGGTSGLVARRVDLLEVQFDPHLPAAQDWDLYLRLLQRGKVTHLPEVLYQYDDHGNDRITRNARRRFLGHAALWRRHIKDQPMVDARSRMSYLAGLKMLSYEAQNKPACAILWRIAYRIMAG